MGRRSRQRDAASTTVRPPTSPPPPRAPSRRARLDEAPQAPWHPVPLVELAVLAGLVMIVVGFVSSGGRREILVTAGVLLASLAGLELSLREHFAGYRSHTLLLALAAALGTGVPVAVLTGDRLVGVIVMAVVGAVAAWLLRRAFTRRSGGLSWKA